MLKITLSCCLKLIKLKEKNEYTLKMSDVHNQPDVFIPCKLFALIFYEF